MKTPKEFWDQLAEHDWWYNMANDHLIYTRGRDSEVAIVVVLKNQPELDPMHQHFSKCVFGDNRVPKKADFEAWQAKVKS